MGIEVFFWRMGPVAVLAVGAALVGVGTALATGPGEAITIDFEGDRIGTSPSGFSVGLTGGGGSPAWKVVEDRTAPTGSKAVAETSGDQTDYRFPLLVLDGFEAKDVQVTVAFKAVSGRVDQAAGLVARLRDARNYYIARANALEGNVRLYRVADGKRTQIAGRDIAVPSGRWQTLGLLVQGDRLEVLFNGQKLFDARDGTFTAPGKVGLWTKADSLTHFDGFRIEPLP